MSEVERFIAADLDIRTWREDYPRGDYPPHIADAAASRERYLRNVARQRGLSDDPADDDPARLATPVRLTLRLPRSLARRLTRAAMADGVSVNAYMAAALADAVARKLDRD